MKSLKQFFVMAFVAVLSLGFSACSGSDTEKLDSYKKVEDAKGFQERINTSTNCCVVDYRSAEEYAEGHIPGAINIPATDRTAETSFKAAMKNIDQSKSIYLYGSKKTNGSMGFYLAGIVSSMGWGLAKTYHLMTGYEGWVDAGLPIEK